MEISALSSYQTVNLAPETEEQATLSPQSARTEETQAPQEVAAGDRVDLVTTQNQVSPLPEPVDLDRASVLVRQVQEQMNSMAKEDMRQLYRFDRLRDLALQVHNQAGV
ncbi:MAG: hypothetical protein A2Y80_10650 [Deltaproteobacteria bacterium RBG_13_58_19]|nr:MAG: hypothetical protein A2Y80_10650 [Deltaproteobacteria bacterium RBG_13_58_19]